jgi:hypothetical protein
VGLVLLGLGGLIVAVTGTDPNAPADSLNRTTIFLQASVALVFGLINAAWTPVVTTAQLMTYVDFRIRREAYDLELLTRTVKARAEIASRAAPGVSSARGPMQE